MLAAVSPQLFSTTRGWALEDLITQNLAPDFDEANSYNPVVDFHTYDQIKQDLSPQDSISSGEATTCGTGDDMKVAKKLNHNASERERRKKVNELYGFLRSLLPISSDEKKKLSIPRTVSRVLKYIPELQKEVETLTHKKEKLSAYSTANTTIKTKSSIVSSVTILGEKEAVIQLISSVDQMNKNKEINLVSKIMEYLEHQEDELVLINATNFKCSGQGMSISTLHVQVQGDSKLEVETLKEKLRDLHQ